MATAVPPIGSSMLAFPEGTTSGWGRLATGVLDLLHEGVLVLSRDASPLGMNRAAHRLLREGDGIALSSRGVVASTADATSALRRGIERAAQGETGRMRVPRLGRAPLAIVVEPHPLEVRGGAAAVVFASDQESRSLRSDVLMARFGLTPTECGVARRLAAGGSLESVAGALGISMNTVRGHLKQIFVKTGTHRQAELVYKLLSES